MVARQVTEHVFRVSLTVVNVFLIVLPDGITLVDAGLRRSWPRIERGLRELGRRPEEVKDIVVTHLHADHVGGLAEARAATGARVWMHPLDARLTAAGSAGRPLTPSPGSVQGKLFGIFAGVTAATVPAVTADSLVSDRQEIPAAGGLIPIWTPGHTEGHVAYLWPQEGGVLFVGDAAAKGRFIKVSPVYEDYQQGLRSLRELAALDFQTACFSHGRPVAGGAAAQFAATWGAPR